MQTKREFFKGRMLIVSCMVIALMMSIFTITPVQAATSITEEEVYERMIAQKQNYPEEMPWTNKNTYTLSVPVDGVTYMGGGCAAFAFILSDAGFGEGEYPARTYETFDNIRVGDILRVSNDTHSVIVLSIEDDVVTIAEGNYNSSIHWGRELSLSELQNGEANYGITRYPEENTDTTTPDSQPSTDTTTPDSQPSTDTTTPDSQPSTDTTTPDSQPSTDTTPDSEPSTELAAPEFGWLLLDGKSYWYEESKRQGTYDDEKGVLGDGTIRGREIYDYASDGWYWLDAVYDGAKAVNKEVWMPYIYQNEAEWNEQEIQNNAAASGNMKEQVEKSIKGKTGKWVRYDANGKMYKGWYTVSSAEAELYPDQVGNTYYYDPKTGLMAKGELEIDGRTYYFDEVTGVLK